jgi:peptide/nickel transport system permease protein
MRLATQPGRSDGFLAELRDSPVLVASAALVALIFLAAMLAPLVLPHDPNMMNAAARLQGPSLTHWFGTDQFGRDVFARVLYGSRTSLQVALVAVGTAVVAGGLIGLVTGYLGGWVDAAVMRVMDVLISFPALLLALFLVAVLGPSLTNLIIAISLTRVPYFARLTRAEAMAIQVRPFVTAVRAMGATHGWIMLRHVAPNVIPTLIIFGTTDLAGAIIAESALSYLGLGAQPPTPSWGRMLTESRAFVSQAPWLIIFPGLFVMVTVIAVNMTGDGLRDLLDPRLKKRR